MWVFNYAIASIGLSVASVYNYLYSNGFVEVEIDKGVMRGRNATTLKGGNYFSFKGIPYAKAPIGDLRFRPPEEETPWDGIREALDHGAVCPHVDIAFDILRGEEDCLFLNVYTPSIEAKALPVMVWIYGGKFALGSANDEIYGPDYFVDANVVLVTFNYRMGALGFLSTGDEKSAGNFGLKDQVAVFKWIKRNIKNFGGDPDNVTIFGGSSGGASVHYHILSPMSKGLFARAISHSGSALNPWAISENVSQVTVRLAEALGAENVKNDTSKALEYLKIASFEDIVKLQEKLITPEEKRMRIDSLFNPSIENNVDVEYREVFLPDSPLNILKSGKFNKVPFITGHASEEGYFFNTELEEPEILESAFDDTKRYVPRDIVDENLRNDLGKSIRNFYFQDKPIGNENISNLVDLYSDATFNAGIKRSTEIQLRSSYNSWIYFYIFSYNGGMNFIKFAWRIDCPGAVHGDELGYLFHHKMMFWKKAEIGSEDEYVLKTMIRLWTNFAKFGNPTPPGDPLIWKPANLEEFNYLNISGWDTRLGVNPDPERTKFWAKAYERDEALRN